MISIPIVIFIAMLIFIGGEIASRVALQPIPRYQIGGLEIKRRAGALLRFVVRAVYGLPVYTTDSVSGGSAPKSDPKPIAARPANPLSIIAPASKPALVSASKPAAITPVAPAEKAQTRDEKIESLKQIKAKIEEKLKVAEAAKDDAQVQKLTEREKTVDEKLDKKEAKESASTESTK